MFQKIICTLFLLVSVPSWGGIPLLSQPIEAEDPIALLLNTCHEEEKRFVQRIKELQDNGINFNQEFQKISNEETDADTIVSRFEEKFNIHFPLNMNSTYTYEWIMEEIFSLYEEYPEQFALYKTYIPLLREKGILENTYDLNEVYSNDGLIQKQKINHYLDNLDALMKGDPIPTFNLSTTLEINRDLSDFKGSRLLMGCYHASGHCPIHEDAKRFDQDYTVNCVRSDDNLTSAEMKVDIASDFYNPALWLSIPDNCFESVIFEGVFGIDSKILLKEILRVLKPGGYVGTMRDFGNKSVDTFIDDDPWVEQTGKSLRNVTYRDVFESCGFVNAENYYPDLESQDNSPILKRAFKPSL